MTEFSKLAERIGKDIDGLWYCCVHLPENESKFFAEWFKPTDKEREKYNHAFHSWMNGYDESDTDNNNLRILALLFAEQLWLDMKEGER